MTRIRLALPRFACAAATLAATLGGTARAQLPPDSALGRFDSALTRLFTPPDVPPGTYRVLTTSLPIEQVRARFKRDVPMPPGVTAAAWQIENGDPGGAFGNSGPYNRAMVAQLYVGRRLSVARGSVLEDGRVIASVTLISPYPDATLTRLERGTMIVVFRTDRLFAR
jgi:hypothetical protein